MASRIQQRRGLPMRKRLFESSRLNEELMAAAYALAAPSISSLPQSTLATERQVILGRTRPAVRGGSTA
jgi:hypothetical protein